MEAARHHHTSRLLENANMRHFFARADPKTHATRPCAREYRHRALHSQAPTASSPPHSQAPMALRASTPQARATFRSRAPRSLTTLRASAPWTSTAFHAPRSAPQAPPHSSRACVFRFGAGRVPVKPAGHHGTRPADLRPGLFSRWPIPHPPRSLPHRSRR